MGEKKLGYNIDDDWFDILINKLAHLRDNIQNDNAKKELYWLYKAFARFIKLKSDSTLEYKLSEQYAELVGKIELGLVSDNEIKDMLSEEIYHLQLLKNAWIY